MNCRVDNSSQHEDVPVLSAHAADGALDHLERMVRATGGPGRVERIQGMDLQYWTSRINSVIYCSGLLDSQRQRAIRLLTELRSSNRV
jgi:hypothetical protein